MAQKQTPGVYVVEKSTLPPSVAEVATAIPVFIGYTEKHEDKDENSLQFTPVKIKNMAEYQTAFGGKFAEDFVIKVPAAGAAYVTEYSDIVMTDGEMDMDKSPKVPALASYMMAQSVEHFFANGGGLCYVVSVGMHGATKAKADFDKALKAVAKVDEITLICMPDATNLPSVSDFYGLQNTAIDQCRKLQDRFTIIDVLERSNETLSSASIAKDAEIMRDSVVGDLKYAGAYYPNLITQYARHYNVDSVKVIMEAAGKTLTLRELGGIEGEGFTLAESDIDTATYNLALQLLNKNSLTLPPSAAVAGAMAKTDKERGVWKAPANVALLGVNAPSRSIRHEDQQSLNVHADTGKSINAIRNFKGKGNLIWGARTLLGNDNEWRYVSVRRFFNMVEESIQKSTHFAVFEPNTPFTWLKIKTMIESYLEGLWRQGALFGETPDQAFFVNVGLGQTMTEDDINNGIMNIEIGMAAVRPAEFIILTFSHKSLEG